MHSKALSVHAVFKRYKQRYPNKDNTYLCMPISTGKDFYERNYLPPELYTPPKADPRATVPISECAGPHNIIPEMLTVEGWGQAEYKRLWKRVLNSCVSRMLVLPGWEYSCGCLEEVSYACDNFMLICFAQRPDASPDAVITSGLSEALAWTAQFKGKLPDDYMRALMTLVPPEWLSDA